MNEKGPDVCAFVDGHQTVPNKLLVLRIVLQGHVGLEKPIHQFFLLVLSSYAAQSSHQHHPDCKRYSHMGRLPERLVVCKAHFLK